MKTLICTECRNDIPLEQGRVYIVGDIIECPVCGTEYEVVFVSDSGELEVQMVEEEK